MVEFVLPDIGEGMHEGEITKWLVQEGDSVHRDQPIVEVLTDKVNTELTSPVAGVIRKVMFAEGVTVEVGKTLVLIDTEPGLQVPPVQRNAPKLTSPLAAPIPPIPAVETASYAKQVAAAVAPIVSDPPAARVVATPYVRQLAREMGIDIEQVKGTSPAGRVTEADLKFYKEQYSEDKHSGTIVDESWGQKHFPITQENVPAEERIPLKGLRKIIAEHMVKSVSTIPHVTHVDEAEVDALKALRERLKTHAESRGLRLTYLPFVIKALALALKQFPSFNASIDERTNEIVLKKHYHIGIATDTEEGLLVPVVKHADRMNLFQLAEEIGRLSALAKEGKLTRDQVTGGTFTISNVGPFGGLFATPIINYPEAAILALHKIEQRMVVRNGQSAIRWMMNVSLSFDHRLIDGVMAVKFTNRLKELLENPELLIMEMV